MKEETKNKFRLAFIIITVICVAVNLFLIGNAAKGWYAEYKCPYSEVLGNDTIWKDVTNTLTISGKSMNGVRVEYYVVMEDRFYDKSHAEQLEIAQSINDATKSYLKQHGVYVKIPEPIKNPYWYIVQSNEYNDFIAYNILKNFADINNVNATYKYWGKDNEERWFTYGYKPDAIYFNIDKQDSINVDIYSFLYNYNEERQR